MCTLADDEVALALWPTRERRGLFGRLGTRKVSLPSPGAVFAILRDEAGLQRVEPDAGGRVVVGERELILVARKSFPCRFIVPAAQRDDAGHPWDMGLDASFSVEAPERFVARMGRGTLCAGSRLKAATVAAMAWGWLEEPARDALEARPLSELKDSRALPARWWQTRFGEWLADFGLAWSVTQDPTWHSAEADAARVAAERQRAEETRRQQQQRELQAQQAARKAHAQYEEQIAAIEHDQQISAGEREHKLGLLRLDYARERAEAESRVQQAIWARDEAELQHRIHIARLHGQLQAAAEQERVLGDLAQRNRQAHEQLHAQRQELAEGLSQLDDGLRARLRSSSPPDAFQALDRLFAPDYGFTVGQLRAVGCDTSLLEFLALIHDAAAGDQTVGLTMQDLQYQTRDVVVHRRGEAARRQVDIRTLRIGDSLRMELATRQSGYATVLNFGTSGRIWLHVPSAFCRVEQSRVDAGQRYPLPGSTLLPWEPFEAAGFEDLREDGPVGREHMIAIVSTTPLVEGALAEPPAPESPFRQLSEADIQTLHQRLAALPEDHWAAAELAFDVVA